MKTVTKVYGPYKRPDGRQHVILMYDDKSRRTVSYPKYLMEQHIGRPLDPDMETVDHIDRDFTNNSLDNLRIISRVQHSKEDALHRDKIDGICAWCGITFTLSRSQLGKRANTKAGPFCSRHCSGKYGASVQNGGLIIDRTKIEVTYHLKDKE